MHQNDLLKTLCKTVEKDITELHKCGITQCLHRQITIHEEYTVGDPIGGVTTLETL